LAIREIAVWRPWSESRGVIPWLFVIAGGLSVTILFKEDILSVKLLGTYGDVLDSIAKIVTIAAVVIGGALSYIRFFRGRILNPKLNIVATTGCLELDDCNMHWLDVELANRGSVAIWNYNVKVMVSLHATFSSEMVVPAFVGPADSNRGDENLIDVGESAWEHAIIRVPKEVQAITFRISVSEESGSMWDRYVTSSNWPC